MACNTDIFKCFRRDQKLENVVGEGPSISASENEQVEDDRRILVPHDELDDADASEHKVVDALFPSVYINVGTNQPSCINHTFIQPFSVI